jgi:hypothetical protein
MLRDPVFLGEPGHVQLLLHDKLTEGFEQERFAGAGRLWRAGSSGRVVHLIQVMCLQAVVSFDAVQHLSGLPGAVPMVSSNASSLDL